MVEESSDELLFSSLPLEYFRQGFCVVFDVFREGLQRFKQIVFFIWLVRSRILTLRMNTSRF